MSLSSAVTSTFTTQRLAGESRPTGALDKIAALMLITAGILYLYFDAFGGLIRFVFPAVGLTFLIYLPALVAVVGLSCNALARIGDPKTAGPVALVLGFIVIEVVVSMLLGRSLAAIGFALYIWLPVFLMMALTQRQMQDRLLTAMAPVFFIAVAGVLLNLAVKFPWADATYEVMGQQREAAREWSAYGQQRLAGLSRASYTAAAQIVIGYCIIEHRLRSLVWRAIWWILAVVAVHYTTSKSPLMTILLLPAMYFSIGRMRQTAGVQRKWIAVAIMAFWTLLIFAGPFLAMTYAQKLYPSGMGYGRGYSSLADRMLNTWPNAIAMIDWHNPVSWLIGRGLGGIGTPQVLFEAGVGNPGDNLAIYLFVMFGLTSLIFAYLIFRGGLRASASASGRGRRDFALIVAMLGIGSAANALESIFPAMIIGLAIARAKPRREIGE